MAMSPNNYTKATSQSIYRFIVWYKERNDGNSPTIREIASAVGLASVSDIPRHLSRLEEQGLIRRNKSSRGIRVIGGKWTGPEVME